MATGTVSYTVVQEDILGPPLGIAGSGSAKVTDTAQLQMPVFPGGIRRTLTLN